MSEPRRAREAVTGRMVAVDVGGVAGYNAVAAAGSGFGVSGMQPMTTTSTSTRRLTRLAMALMGLLALVSPAPASAQDDAGKKDGGVIDLGELEIEGKISKPQVFYVLGRAEFRYRGLKLDQSFVDRIVTSARKNPF